MRFLAISFCALALIPAASGAQQSAKPLAKALGLTPRVAETLLWMAQGKTNSDIATILGISESTVKKHVLETFVVLGVETRTAAGLRALEVLSSPAARPVMGDTF